MFRLHVHVQENLHTGRIGICSVASITASLRPYFLHRQMIPKWLAPLALGALVAVYTPPAWWVLTLVGALLFFPGEYIVHRFQLHVLHDKKWNVTAHSHIAHHEAPDDLEHIFHPLGATFGALGLYIVAVALIFWSVPAGLAFGLGSSISMILYEYAHFSAHRIGVQPATPWMKYLKKYHLWHHFKNEHYWFGVTSPFVDVLFGTFKDPKTVEKSPTVRTVVPNPDHVRLLAEQDA